MLKRGGIGLPDGVPDQAVGVVALDTLRAEIGLYATTRTHERALWNSLFCKLAYRPVAYSEEQLEYKVAYARSIDPTAFDYSLILYHDHHPCGLWPLTVRPGTVPPIGYGDNAVVPPIFVSGLSERAEKKIVLSCLRFLEHMARNGGHFGWVSSESRRDQIAVSIWQQKALELGAKASLKHDLYCDLSRSIAEIRSGIRKSYRSLINTGLRCWKIEVLEHASLAAWNEFRALHKKSAGRSTRSDESWNLQHEAIERGAAFLVLLRASDDRAVGGGYFRITDTEGMYSVGAYDRSLFDNPLGHVVQFRAIELMKERGLTWYHIGSRQYPSDLPTPSLKEITIAEFKQGFSTHVFPKYELSKE